MKERQVFQIALDLGHPESMGGGGVDLQGLLGDALLRRLGHVLQSHHVVKSVGQLDQDHPNVAHRSENQLAKGLRLRFVTADVGVPSDLGDAVHEVGNLCTESLLQHLLGRQGVLEDIVEEGHDRTGLIEAELSQDIGDVGRMGHIGLAGPPHLIGMHLLGEGVGRAQAILVSRAAVSAQRLEDVLELHRIQDLHRRPGTALGATLPQVGHDPSVSNPLWFRDYRGPIRDPRVKSFAWWLFSPTTGRRDSPHRWTSRCRRTHPRSG